MSVHWVLLFVGLVTAVVYFPRAGRPLGPTGVALKTAPLVLFAAAAFLADVSPYLTAGLALSALGDFTLTRRGRAGFLYGLSAFALAHVLYIIGFQSLADLPLWEAFATAPLAAIILLLLALSSEIWLGSFAGSLRWPVRAYIVLITAMGLAALLLPKEYWLVTLGAGLFILSDTVLSVRMFRMADDGAFARAASRLLWALYIAGQALIVAGVALN